MRIPPPNGKTISSSSLSVGKWAISWQSADVPFWAVSMHFSSVSLAARRRAALLEEAAGLLRPGGSLVVVEPALRETSRQLLEVRDLLVARGFVVRAPCLFRGACPARLRETDWCHAERPVEPPPLVAEIARRVAERFNLKYVRIASMTGGLPGVRSYLDLLRVDTERIASALAASTP